MAVTYNTKHLARTCGKVNRKKKLSTVVLQLRCF